MIYGVGNFEWGKMGPQSGSQEQEDTGAQWGGGGLPYKKDGETHQNFGREPLRGTNSKTAYYLVPYFFRFSILTGDRKSVV